MNKPNSIFRHFIQIFCLAYILNLSGCATVANPPAPPPVSPSFQIQGDNAEPVRVAIRTSFKDGANAIHFQRANAISNDISQILNKSGTNDIVFFPVDQFAPISGVQYDYLLDLNGGRPVHETKRNKPLLLLGWPATLSVVAAPLGIIILSIPGIVKETATFDWQANIVPRHYESLILEAINLQPQMAVVSASAWGIPKEKAFQSYQNADSHIKNQIIDFVSSAQWNQYNDRVKQYAQSHPASGENRLGFKYIPKSPDRTESIDNRFAVIIGISKYMHASDEGLTNLDYADDDAEEIYQSIKQNGWKDNHIKCLINEKATKRQVSIILESWLTMANNDDIILLFWAGHAYPDPTDAEKVYFACYDTDINIPSTGYRMDYLRQSLEERKARNVIIIADTCHAGKLITRSGDRGLSIRPYLEKVKKANDVPPGWVFMVSAEADRKAIEDSSWGHGAFTHCLLDAFKGKADGFESAGERDNSITLGEVRAYLNSQMPSETLNVFGVAKHPIITTSTGDPEIWQLPLIDIAY